MSDAIHFSVRTLQPEALRAAAETDAALVISARAGSALADAIDIADESAVALIECETLEFDYGDGVWHNLDSSTDSDLTPETNNRIRAGLDQAVRYLTARGLAETPEGKPHLVRFKEPA